MDEALRFFIDQVVRQYQELKNDIRTEVGDLKKQLAADAGRAAEDLREYKSAVEERFRHLEGQLEDLKQFRWTMAGAAALAFGVAEIAVRVLEWYLSRK